MEYQNQNQNQNQNQIQQVNPQNNNNSNNIILEYINYDFKSKFFLNCIIQMVFFICMLIMFFEFYFFKNIKDKLTNDINNNINFYIQNLDLNKMNNNDKYFDINMIKNIDYDKIIQIINDDKSILSNINRDKYYVYVMLLLFLLILLFSIVCILTTEENINFSDFIYLISQNIIIFFVIGIFEYYYLNKIINKYIFINNNDKLSKNIMDIIKSQNLI